MNTPALELRGVSVSVGVRQLLHHIHLSIPARGLVGIVGPNGCGKTSLLRTALGLLACNAGEILVGGRRLEAWPARELARHVGYMAQQVSSHWDLSVREYLQLQAPSVADLSTRWRELVPLLDRSFVTLSGGEKARVGMARALAHEPRLLLADEPAAHLDIPHHHGLMASLKDAARDRAVVVVLHDLHVASMYCDKLALMGQGRLLAWGTPTDVLTSQTLATAYGEQIDTHQVGLLRFFTGGRVAEPVE